MSISVPSDSQRVIKIYKSNFKTAYYLKVKRPENVLCKFDHIVNLMARSNHPWYIIELKQTNMHLYKRKQKMLSDSYKNCKVRHEQIYLFSKLIHAQSIKQLHKT